MPTEPMLMGLLVLFTFRAFSGTLVDKRLLTHPMTLLIGGMMVWMMIATATSSHPLVSIKFFISRTWFIVGFYLFLGTSFFTKRASERTL